jgi:hypothetical protein
MISAQLIIPKAGLYNEVRSVVIIIQFLFYYPECIGRILTCGVVIILFAGSNINQEDRYENKDGM